MARGRGDVLLSFLPFHLPVYPFARCCSVEEGWVECSQRAIHSQAIRIFYAIDHCYSSSVAQAASASVKGIRKSSYCLLLCTVNLCVPSPAVLRARGALYCIAHFSEKHESWRPSPVFTVSAATYRLASPTSNKFRRRRQALILYTLQITPRRSFLRRFFPTRFRSKGPTLSSPTQHQS